VCSGNRRPFRQKPHQRNCRTFLSDAGCLLEGIGELQDAKIIAVAADNLDADGQSP